MDYCMWVATYNSQRLTPVIQSSLIGNHHSPDYLYNCTRTIIMQDPALFLALLAGSYYIIGVKGLDRSIGTTVQQQMGQFLAHRVKTFPQVGLAGPLLCYRGNPRKLTRINTYACIFAYFTTFAVHIELLSDLSTHAFLGPT